MGIALIMLMAGFIKICSVHTPSSNPKLPPHKPLPGKQINILFSIFSEGRISGVPVYSLLPGATKLEMEFMPWEQLIKKKNKLSLFPCNIMHVSKEGL